MVYSYFQKQQQMSNQIAVPSFLVDNPRFFNTINDNNSKVFGHVEYIRQLVTNMHQMYHQLCKKLVQVTEDYERKIISSCKNKTEHSEVIVEFIRSIAFIHYSISNQLNSNTVTLGGKNHRIAKNRLEILKERMLFCYHINKEYVRSVELFNKEEKQFRSQCQYFNDYEKDVIKYFSLKGNVEKHEKLQLREIKLKEEREQIFRKKQEYQENVHQCRALIKDYFQLQKTIISDYSRLLLNIRKRKANRTSNRFYAQPILEQPSNQMNTSTNKGQLPITNRSERFPQKSVASLRRQLMKEEERIKCLQGVFDQFLIELQELIKKAGEKIDALRDDCDYCNFINDKIVMLQILPVDSTREIDMIINEVTLFRTIILNIQTNFGKFKLLKEIGKYRIYNFDKFIQETEIYVQSEKRTSMTQSSKNQYVKLQNRFLERNHELMVKYRERIVELQQIIVEQFYREEVVYGENKNRKIVHNDIFVKAYYQNLMHAFFLNRSQVFNYHENRYLKKLSSHLSANQIQNAMTLEGFNSKKKRKTTSCCGFFQSKEEDEEEGPPLIDDFHCSLKDGLLIRGILKLFQNYVSFTSTFNPKTFFGFSDIRIPKWNILHISLGTHLLADKVIIQTTHGNLQFTDFFNSPFELLVKTYETKKSGVSTLHKNSEGDTEVVMLQQRFQSNFQADLLKVGINVDKLSTYLSLDKEQLSISIEYHKNGSSLHSLFQIKIIEKDIAIQYVFIHDEKCKSSNQIKNLLEKVSKELINRKTQETTTSLKKIGKISAMQYSIIEGNQKNKMSFIKEPSFIGGKDYSLLGDLDELKASQNSFGNLLTSKNLLQTSKNFQLEKQSPPLTAVRKSLSDEQGSSTQNFMILQTARLSTQGQKEEQRPTQKTFEEKRQTMIPVPEIKHEISRTSKQSKISKSRRKKGDKEIQSGQNYSLIISVLIGVILLNILVKIFIN